MLNEERHLGTLLNHLEQNSNPGFIEEILCVDGGSHDNTFGVAEKYGARTIPSKRGRARQMNLGAKHAKGEILYFLHADTLPPKNFDATVHRAVDQGFETGCFRMRFDTKNLFLRFFAWFSRINHALCRGGDQSLFITKKVFLETKGFNERYLIYEDTEFIRRLYRHTRFKVLPEHVITSARRYRELGWFKLQYHFAIIHVKNYLGAGPEELYRYYQKHVLA